MGKPCLILYSVFSSDSKILRQTATDLGWKTLRLGSTRLPDWFENESDSYALFWTVPQAFAIAKELSVVLLGCDAYWIANMPEKFVKREIRICRLKEAFNIRQKSFVKPALSKTFRAGIYDRAGLMRISSGLPDEFLVCIAEPVRWTVEYRCFIAEKQVVTISPYLRNGKIFLDASYPEVKEARLFALSVLDCPQVPSPPAFVMDVGIIENRGWAVVEHNECWAAGIYGCDPVQVLHVLLKACVPGKNMGKESERWNFEKHFLSACPQYRQNW